MLRRAFKPEHVGIQGHSGSGCHLGFSSPNLSYKRDPSTSAERGTGMGASVCGSLCPPLHSPPGRSFQPAGHRDPHRALHGHPAELCSTPKSEVRVLLLYLYHLYHQMAPRSIWGCAKFPWITDPIPNLLATSPGHHACCSEVVKGVIKTLLETPSSRHSSAAD